MLTIREDHDQEPQFTPNIEAFFAPPPFTLPESIRKTVRDVVALQDTDWIKRHPNSGRREVLSPATEGKPATGPVFSEVPAYVTIGQLEHAISLYRALETAPLAREEFAQTVGATAHRLKETVADLDRMVAGGWDQLFFVRGELARELPALLRLLQTIDEVASARSDENLTEHGETIPPRDVMLIRILAEILASGGLPCSIEERDGETIRSPGLELLLQCLDQAGLQLSRETVAKLLLSTS